MPIGSACYQQVLVKQGSIYCHYCYWSIDGNLDENIQNLSKVVFVILLNNF